MLPPILFASRNSHKFSEMSHALGQHGISIVPCPESVPALEESGETLEANAQQKAKFVALACGSWALGDDTGLFVDFLNGAPGVLTARYAGTDASAEQNRAKLLTELSNANDYQRTAHFECSLALVDPQGELRLTATGRCRGRILPGTRGPRAFGYDSLFWIPEYHCTLAELSLAAKTALSHRGRAAWKLAQMAKWPDLACLASVATD